MRRKVILLAGLALASLTGCAPRWPADRFPAGLEVQRTLLADRTFGLREGCAAMVVELTSSASMRVMHFRRTKDGLQRQPPAGWTATPMITPPDHAFYAPAFAGCHNEGEAPLGDLPGWLHRPGAFYRVINDGEGIAIIVPESRLAGYFYLG